MYMDNIRLFARNEKDLESRILAAKIYSPGIWMEFSIEKCAILIMRSRKQHMTEGIELPNQEKKRMIGEKKLTNTWEYWKLTPSKKWRWRKKLKKSIFGEQGDYSKPNYIAETLSKGWTPGMCTPCEILETILQVDEGRTSTNGPENKKTHDNE